ncbi:MAG: nucleotidyltransferase domain-containing protein [Desulfarculus sp.]|nr:nucleotidyltransferase domain-containing protein [Desulfarculus sp.]
MSEQAKPTPEAVRELAAKLVPVLKRYGVVRAGVFGSVARGEAGPDSDLDLLVEYRKDLRKSLFDLVHLSDELEAVAGRKVEVCEYHLLREIIRDNVMADHVAIL